MNLLDKIKSLFNRIFNKCPKQLESPNINTDNISDSISKIRNEFEESLRVNLTAASSSTSGSTIESLQCINDGLGFQKIKNY